jgi:hypothetical protein
MSLFFQTSFRIPYIIRLSKHCHLTLTDTHHVIPSGDNGLHVEVTGEERDDAIGHDLAVLDKDRAKVAHNGRVVAYLEPRADSYLVAAASYYLFQRLSDCGGHVIKAAHQRKKCIACQGHGISLLHDRSKL